MTACTEFAIAELPVGEGCIGIARAPATLAVDLDRIAAWGTAMVVTLLEAHELEFLGIAAVGGELQRRNIAWRHWPIADYAAPDRAFAAAWTARSASLRYLLARGGRVLIHCKAGLGRSGTLAARLLVEHGIAPPTAIATVRAARPGAIETEAQERWVAAYSNSVCSGANRSVTRLPSS